MNPLQTIAETLQVLSALNWSALESWLDELERGGLPSSSIPNGSRSSETSLPLPDRVDITVRQVRADYGFHVSELFEHAAALRRLERVHLPPSRDREPRRYGLWIADMARLAVELRSPRAVECANRSCRRIVERTAADRLLEGRCENCYRYRREHEGRERPRDVCERDQGRQREAS